MTGSRWSINNRIPALFNYILCALAVARSQTSYSNKMATKVWPFTFFCILNMAIAVDWDINQCIKQTKQFSASFGTEMILAALWKNQQSAYAKTMTQISFAVTAKLISVFVFATRIVQSLYFLNTKFHASSCLLWLYSPVCVGPGQKPHCWFSLEAAHLWFNVLPDLWFEPLGEKTNNLHM